MSRLQSAMKIDVQMQLRNNLYSIGIGVGMLVAVMVALLARPAQLWAIVPTLLLLVVGGSTLLYVSGMIVFERDQGTLSATIVSPLRTAEYLSSKVITLTALATLEAIIMVGGAMLIMRFSQAVPLPNLPLLLLGIVAIGAIYTLVGIVLIVRYTQFTDVIIPISVVAVVLQLPFLHFLGWIEHPAFLLIPTSAPAMLMRGAYIDLAAWEWLYGAGYSMLWLVGLAWWAYRAFQRHIIMKGG